MTTYAETWLDVGRLPLRRRDRAAMVLALECLRWYPRATEADHALRDASDALRLPMWEVGPRTAIGAALGEAVEQTRQDDLSCRLLRARLALLLRTLLRVDAGDYGALECDRCAAPGDWSVDVGDICGWCWRVRRGSAEVGNFARRRVTLLWESARRAGR